MDIAQHIRIFDKMPTDDLWRSANKRSVRLPINTLALLMWSRFCSWRQT